MDEKKLINWMDATPRAKTNVKYVDAEGIMTKEGVATLAEYLKMLDLPFTVDLDRILEKKNLLTDVTNDPLKAALGPLNADVDRVLDNRNYPNKFRGNDRKSWSSKNYREDAHRRHDPYGSAIRGRGKHQRGR
uniref:Uncharacterized protein n=1 Tax=Panagrolaimus superbus TaxID=310955 RepID=A0A914Z9K3_9BILA